MLLKCKETDRFRQCHIPETRGRHHSLSDSVDDVPEIGGEDWDSRGEGGVQV